VTRSERTEVLVVARAADIAAETATGCWLVESLWSEHGVGVIGGAPKSFKTWLALDLAVSVASATPALGHFSVTTRGPVLIYGAEDAPAQLRSRIDMIAASRRLPLEHLDVSLILEHALRLDTERDRRRLAATIEHHRPRLLILDPLVRLHRTDENSAGDMSAILAELRSLQRRYELALILVHHLRKNAPARTIDGLALRGSGDLYAWGDCNLFLKRREKVITLTIEHRAAPAPEPCTLELATDPTPHLHVLDATGASRDQIIAANTEERILDALAQAEQPLSRQSLRDSLRIRNATLGDALVRLRAQGIIRRRRDGFLLRERR
jgi:RecA-family ATPase